MRIRFIRLCFNASLSIFFILTISSLGQAQSGRRAPKPLSPPTPAPSPKEPEQPPAPKPVVKQQTVIAGIDTSFEIPDYISDIVWNGFVERFNKASGVILSGEKTMNRKGANERAKKSTESPVVLLQLTTQSSAGSMGQVSIEDIVVNFTIFTPGTGKVSESGRVYVRSNRSVLGRLPTGRYGDSLLRDAGRETADRVLALLHVVDSEQTAPVKGMF